MNKRALARMSGVAAVAISASVALGLPAQAAAPAGGSNKGTCTESSHIKLNVMSEKNMSQKQHRLRVMATITGGQNGDSLAYVITDNGAQVVAGVKITKQNGKTIVRKSIRNLRGTDTIIFTSTNAGTAEVCTAEVTYGQHH
jgi:hypothetical protein